MVAVLGEIHRGCPLPGQQPACLARLGPGAGVCGCGSCPAQPGGATRLAAESTQSLQTRTGDTAPTPVSSPAWFVARLHAQRPGCAGGECA